MSRPVFKDAGPCEARESLAEIAFKGFYGPCAPLFASIPTAQQLQWESAVEAVEGEIEVRVRIELEHEYDI